MKYFFRIFFNASQVKKKNKNTQKEIDKKEKKRFRENVANKQNLMNCNKKVRKYLRVICVYMF